MNRTGLKPRFRFGPEPPAAQGGYQQVLPLRRSWKVIAGLAVMDAIFFVPAYLAFGQAAEQWSRVESLFDLVFAMFISAWLMGWSVALAVMTAILLALLFGREVMRACPGEVELFLGLPGIGIAANYDASHMRNLRIEATRSRPADSWRGDHLAFDYGANHVAFGSDLDTEDASRLMAQIERSTGISIRRGEASPEEVQTPWEAVEKVKPVPVAAEVDGEEPVTLTSPSSLVLIFANLAPIIGALFLGWKLSDVLVLYWAESAVIGFYTICKIIIIGRWKALLAVPFFIGHFGAFMAVHFMFIFSLFVEGINSTGGSGGSLKAVGALFVDLWPAMLALFVSHGYSFVRNFLGREHKGITLNKQMSEPYRRIIFMQLVLIFGGWLVMLLGSPEFVVIIVIGLKVFFDLKAHIREHRQASPE